MKYVYSFKEGNKDMRNILGGKGANLAEMCGLGLPVPMGFTVSCDACLDYYANNMDISSSIVDEIKEQVSLLEEYTGKVFGDKNNPLLVSVRSGARASMPGMMDTVLNLGLNDEIVSYLIDKTSDGRFVYDCYRRFIMMYSDVVMGYDRSSFDSIFDSIKTKRGVVLDTELTSSDLEEIVSLFKEKYYSLAGVNFPQDVYTQLFSAISAVFRSWNNERAIYYRKMNDIPDSWGTAVNVQEMVYGNINDNSGTGVLFTRNPSTGENVLYGEFLINAQGEDVVAGVRTPYDISKLKEMMPSCYEEFVKISKVLENHYRDMQDMEFTISDGKLYILQTRNGKRTGEAALRIAVDMVNEGLITKEEALLSVDAKLLDQLLHPVFDKNCLSNAKVIAKGLAASPGAASGKICFDANSAIAMSKDSDVILVRLETSPEDIAGMKVCKGVLTIHGGMTSHAAVVARGMGTCCVSGCSDLVIDYDNKTLISGDIVLHEGDYISLDGSSGIVYLGLIATVSSGVSDYFNIFMDYASSYGKLKVLANADNYNDASVAKKYGASGIGLCRTEHMFFDKNRIFSFRKMILSFDVSDRKSYLDEILPYQREDFISLFKVMDGLDVTIRLLDPPLHEFLPKEDSEINELASSLKLDYDVLVKRIDSLKEFNPMMGHRGCRLGITYPEIVVMQTKAIIEAAISCKKEGFNPKVEIMVPLVGEVNELKYIKSIIDEEAKAIFNDTGLFVDYLVGTMIEVPRAAVTADMIAPYASFFSFGTNDLTQMTYGYSRDDASKFLDCYYSKGILENDPFVKLDINGVGELIKIAVFKARSVNPNIKLGICGEHGGDPSSIKFCNDIDLTYVSCSPYRIPVARLAAAQATIKDEKAKLS